MVFLRPQAVSSFPVETKSVGDTVIYPIVPSFHVFLRAMSSVVPSCFIHRFTMVATHQVAVIIILSI